MRSVTYRLADLNKVAIPIGFVGENEHTRVTFDCKKVFDEYPSALAALTVQPPYGAAYPAVVVRSGDTVYWDVYDSDLAHEGRGEAQLTFSENDVVVKSFIFRTIIERSIMGAGEAPEPLDDFLARAGEALTAIPQTIEDTFAQISAEAETLAPGSAATASFDDETMKLSFGIPKGEKGDQGEQGETGQTGPQGVSVTNAVVNDDYTLTLTFSDGDSYTSQSIRGPQGETGQTGQTGATPDFSIGTVTTGAAGSSAEASITGTAEAPVLNLTIPRGDKGSKGDKGNKGDTGATPAFSIGTVTTGAAGSDAAATITGTTAAPVLNLTIPRGASGDGGMIAQLYSSSNTYAVGDHVEYNGAFYVCKTAITTAEVWNSAHWTQTTAGDELTSQKADIDGLESAIAKDYSFTWTKGGMFASGGTDTSANATITDLVSYVDIIGTRFCVKSGVNVHVGFWNGSTYIGKVAANGSINKTSGDWMNFTGTFDISTYIPQDSDSFKIVLIPTDGTVITTDNAATWSNSKFYIADRINVLNEELESDIADLDAVKANIDGYYDSMTVGNAEQLVATVGVEDKDPYNFRTAGGSADIGDRLVEKLVGGTVAWNQMLQYSEAVSSHEKYGVTFTRSSPGFRFVTSGTYSYSSGDRNVYVCVMPSSDTRKVVAGHKYLVTNTSKYYCVYVYSYSADGITFTGNKLNVSNQGGVIVTPDKSGRYMVSLAGGSNIANNTVMNETICICFYDLTQMFGSTIADYVYNLEQTTRGAGLAWFRRYFPKEYYSYDSGSLQSVNTSAHRTNGFNQWDEQWESGYFSSTGVASASSTAIRSKNFIKCLPNTTYYGQIGYSGASLFVCWYDSSQTFISRQDIRKTTNTSPANAQYFKICTGTNYTATYQNDICINLHWDGERDGEYEAYVEHTYPLGNVELRGIPKLDANNELYYDGDTYESDGTVTRRFGIVDLGSLTYTANSHQTLGDYFYASVGNLGIKYVGAFATTKYDTVTPKYSYTKRNSTDFIDKTFTFDGSTGSVTQIQFKDSAYSDASTFKTSLSGIYLLYELATPTTESADAFQNPQIVDDWGTEEYVDRPSTAGTPTRDVAIPVGHDSMYQANLRAKLEMAPDSPSDGNGDYVVRQTDGINEYVKLVIPTELPSNPSEDGTYILKATVSGGTTTLSWEVQS